MKFNINSDLDFYNTDPSVVNDLLTILPQLKNRDLKVLEPCAGEGILADRFTFLTKNKVDMYDIKSRREDIIEKDYMELDAYNKYDVIITNFPFKEATSSNPIGFSELLNKALNDVKAGGYVCSFQRLTSLESKRRYQKTWCRRPPNCVYVYSHRLKHTKDNKLCHTNDAYCWCIFHKDETGHFASETKLKWIY